MMNVMAPLMGGVVLLDQVVVLSLRKMMSNNLLCGRGDDAVEGFFWNGPGKKKQ